MWQTSPDYQVVGEYFSRLSSLLLSAWFSHGMFLIALDWKRLFVAYYFLSHICDIESGCEGCYDKKVAEGHKMVRGFWIPFNSIELGWYLLFMEYFLFLDFWCFSHGAPDLSIYLDVQIRPSYVCNCFGLKEFFHCICFCFSAFQISPNLSLNLGF